MRIFFDQNVPRNIVRYLPGHEVKRAYEMGWDDLKNGELLKQAETNGFDALVTADKNLRYQQNLSSRRIAIIELSTNNWPLIKPHIEQVVLAVNKAVIGSYTNVRCGVFGRHHKAFPKPDS